MCSIHFVLVNTADTTRNTCINVYICKVGVPPSLLLIFSVEWANA